MSRRAGDPQVLDLIFGEVAGRSAEERARNSTRQFVRGLDLLTFDERPKATGRRLTAREALDAYGFDTLAEVAYEGSAIICESAEAAGRALKERREQLGIGLRRLASRTELSVDVVEAIEASKRRPIQEYERVARVLGLDERMISFRRDPGGNDHVAVRLRQLADSKPVLSQSVVVALSEAAWVAMTQTRLARALGASPAARNIGKSTDYGPPAYVAGYELADDLRGHLGLGSAPIPSMREVVESTLRIPLIQTDLGPDIAGATVDSGSQRAIVLNTGGLNQHAFMRRATLAHELCHILYDDEHRLRGLRVDSFNDLQRDADQLPDAVEQRANAFAVQLLAPQMAALHVYQSTRTDPLGEVLDHFGISFTAARYQIWNALKRTSALGTITTDRVKPQVDWEGREAYTTAYHPVRSLASHPARAGRFSALVLRAAEQGLITWDTAKEWLLASSANELKHALPVVRDQLYPDVFR